MKRKSAKYGSLSFLALLFFLLPFDGLYPQAIKLNIKERLPILQSSKGIWFSEGKSVYQYNASDDAVFSLSLPPQSPANNRVRQIFSGTDRMWFLLDSGVAALFMSTNDWQYFSYGSGLPSSNVIALSIGEDYVWVATDSGFARFDLLIEQWETFRGGIFKGLNKIDDIYTISSSVWIISGDSLFEYDFSYEKLKSYPMNLPQAISGQSRQKSINRIFPAASYIWILSNGALLRFNKDLRSSVLFEYSELADTNLIEFYYSDSQLWFLTSEGFKILDVASSTIKDFEGNSQVKKEKIISADISSSQLLLLCENKLLYWDFSSKNWNFVALSSSLKTQTYSAAFNDGNVTLLMRGDFCDYRNSSASPFKNYKFASQSSGGSSRLLKNLFDNDEGGSVNFGGNNILSFYGTRINDIYNYEKSIASGNEYEPITGNNARIDFKSQLNFASGRKITAYYNNIDFAETMYGAKYRGLDSDTRGDIVREINWGDFRKESKNNFYSEKASIFGSNIWLQFGNKTPKFKRPVVEVRAATGELRTKKVYEKYQGAFNSQKAVISDVQYISKRYYALSSFIPEGKISELEIYLDSKIPIEENTLTDTTIAGVKGNFNKLTPAVDYFLIENRNLVQLQFQIQNKSNLVARFRLNGTVTESILQLDSSFSLERKNVYYLWGKNILPYSFTISIKDTSGKQIPLSNYKLAASDEDKISSEHIDYRNGLLFFPELYPFPADVYLPSKAKSSVKFEVNYKTSLSMIQLNNINLVRGSESLRIDGSQAQSGSDYIIDYSNGTLIFVREGILNPDTRIEIEYEHYLDESGKLHYASVNFSPSDNFYLQADWQSENPKVNNQIMLNSEIRKDLFGFNLRFLPALQYETEDTKLTSVHYNFFMSNSWLRLQNTYDNFSTEYTNLYNYQSVFGNIRQKMLTDVTADIFKELRLSFTREDLTGSSNKLNNLFNIDKNLNDNTTKLTAQFHGSSLPAFQISVQENNTNFADSTSKKNFLTALMDYQLPRYLLKFTGLNDLKIEYFFRAGNQDLNDRILQLIPAKEKTNFLQNYININTKFTEQIQASVYYRANNLNMINGSDLKIPLQNSERLLINFSEEQWRFLQFNMRFENNLDQYHHYQYGIKNYNNRQFAQLNFRISPGVLYSSLKNLFFEINANQSGVSYGTSSSDLKYKLWQLEKAESNQTDYSRNRNLFIKNEFHLNANTLFTTSYESSKQNIRNYLSEINRYFIRLSEKIDLKADNKTRFVIKYQNIRNDYGFGSTSNEHQPSVWLERRWSESVLNILNVIYINRRSENINILQRMNSTQLQYDFLYRKSNLHWIDYLEFRQSLSFQYSDELAFYSYFNRKLISSSSLDIYPVKSLIFRLRYDVSKNWTYGSQTLDNLLMNFNLKITLQM